MRWFVLLQINKLRGSKARVELKNGCVLSGTLAFFNYNEQVIHLQDYVLTKSDGGSESGAFRVVNRNAWYTLAVDDKVYDGGGDSFGAEERVEEVE